MTNFVDLSERETEILQLVATGVSNKEIARELNISTNTVKVHLKNIFAKLGVLSRTEATLYAIEHHIVDAPGRSELVKEEGTKKTPSFLDNRWVLLGAGLVLIAGVLTAGYFLSPSRPDLTPTIQPTYPVPTAIPRWQELAPMPEGRAGMAAAIYENQVYLFAGEIGSGITGDSMRYDIKNQTWNPISGKPTAVSDIQAALMGEKIYIPGGRRDGSVSAALEVYNPRTDTWENHSPLPQPRSGYALVTYEGKMILFGGWDGKKVRDSVYIYNPSDDSWIEMTHMPIARAFMSASTFENKIILIGGWNGEKNISSASVYLPARDRPGDQPWSTVSPSTKPFCRAGSASIGSNYYIIGLESYQCPSINLSINDTTSPGYIAYQYLEQSDTWGVIESPPDKIGLSSAVVVNGNYLYFFGGLTINGLSARAISYQALYTSAVPVIINP
jgi:DNA-binding CsgD family transcriptional regulator